MKDGLTNNWFLTVKRGKAESEYREKNKPTEL